MTELQRYLAEEVAEDLADGIITRREAMRRLGLMGLTGAAATGILSTAASEAVAGGGHRGAGARSGAPACRASTSGRPSRRRRSRSAARTGR